MLFQGSKHLNEYHNLDLMPGDLSFQAVKKIKQDLVNKLSPDQTTGISFYKLIPDYTTGITTHSTGIYKESRFLSVNSAI